ncbi:MAG: class I SAM-dependent methyltransferase [Bifidobacteriaceae bacterium]|jgi:predicted O-methyltransferase YrrM|nr:class I SAM-dependent methyltransferase [Bifidobacteriaceae bacterium]
MTPHRAGTNMVEDQRLNSATCDFSTNWAFAEEFLVDPKAVARARDRAAELGVCVPSAGACRLLTVVTAASQTRQAVEIGTGSGVAALAVLAGLAPGGVLTSIDAEAEHQVAARQAFADFGISPNATRLINSSPESVLPRLTDSAYDLVRFTATAWPVGNCLDDCLRILRPGGLLAIDGAYGFGRVPDPARRDPSTVAIRELGRKLRARDDLQLSMVPVGDGMLLAARSPAH